MELTIVKVFLPTALAFAIGMLITPLVTHYLYKYKIWKKRGGKIALDGSEAVAFNKLKQTGETRTPRMGGIIIWSSVLLTILLVAALEFLIPQSLFGELNFFSRSQTWIPLAALMVGAALGFLNDWYDVNHSEEKGVKLRTRLVLITILSMAIGWWFYDKLDVSSISMLWYDDLELGILFIPFFALVALAVYASGVIDGIDGLSGGVFMFIFAAYTGIGFMQMQYDIAAFCATVVGGILAFLWFNIPPARFYMTETGSMALTLCLTIVAFMTDTLGGGEGVSVLPIIGFLLVATVASNVIQVLSKRIRGKKVFLVAPLHHHFEALGWPAAKVTMRYWVLGFVFAIIGILLSIAF